MDHSEFDKFIREKLERDRNHPFNQTGLDSFHSRMSGYQRISFHKKYRTEIFIAASLLMFTLANAFIGWQKIYSNDAASSNELAQNSRIDSLENVIYKIQKGNTTTTLHTTEHQQTIVPVVNSPHASAGNNEKSVDVLQNGMIRISLGKRASIPLHIYQKLEANHEVSIKDGEAYLILSVDNKENFAASAVENARRIVPMVSRIEVEIPEIVLKKNAPAHPLSDTNEISMKTRDEMEKHYFSGLGIDVAPHVDWIGSIYSKGTGGITPRIGVTTDWVVSPHLSLEAGIDYFATAFKVNRNFDDFNKQEFADQVGPIRSLKVSSYTFSSPVSIKYRQWISGKSQVIFRTGYTPYFSVHNQYVYTYAMSAHPKDSDLTIDTIDQVDKSRFFGGTFTFSAGIQKMVRSKKKFEMSFLYEKNIGKIGPDKQRLQLVGLRTAFWLHVR